MAIRILWLRGIRGRENIMASPPETFDPTAFDRLARAEPGHFWFEERRRLIAWALARHFPDARRFCEVGCGTGFVLAGLARDRPQLELTGVDPYPQALALAASRVPDARFVQGSILDPPDAGVFDVVGCFDVLEHIPDDRHALAALARRVSVGGGLILTVPQHPRLWSVADEIGHHQRRYTRSALLRRLRDAGLLCRRVTSFVTTLLPVLALRRATTTREEALAELHPSPFANAIGRRLLRLEARLIAGGVSLPVGGSLLVVAEKPADPA